MTEKWTLTGSLADFGLDPVAGASVVVTHDPPVWVDDAGDRLLVREEREPVADDGTFTIELAVTGGNYRVATTPRSLFSPFRFPSPDGGSHALHDLYLAHHGVPVPSPGAPLVKGDPGEPGASVVGGRDNGDGTISFELSDGTWTAPVPVPSGPGGTGAVSSVNGKTGAVVLGASDVGALPSSYTPPAQSWTGITGKPTTFAPTAHAASHATGGSDPITPESIGASPAGHGHAAAAITDLTETVQDIVGALIKAGTGTTVSYDDDAGTVTITATATGGSTDPEIVRDVIGSAMVAGSGIQITVNDAGDTITIASTAVLPTRKVIAGTGLTGGGDLSADRTLSVSYGTTAGTAAQGNDARLSDARTPTAHTHAAGDVTSGTFTPARLGTGTPSASTVLYGDGAWKDAPNGGGGGLATGDVQFAVARSGTATTLAPHAFTTYPLDGTPTTNIGGGTWNASAFVYTVPEDGLYLCLGAIRIADGSAARNVMIGIHTSNADGPFGLWQTIGVIEGGARCGAQYTRLTRFLAGQGVRMFIYSDGTAFTTASDGAGQSMSITKVAD